MYHFDPTVEDLFHEMIVIALACGLTQVFAHEFTQLSSGYNLAAIGLDKSFHNY